MAKDSVDTETDVEFQRHQFDAMWAPEPHVALVTGLGGGKSWAGARWILLRAIQFPESKHLVTINSLDQAQDVVVPALEEACEELNLETEWRRKQIKPNLHIWTGDMWATIRIRSTFKPATIRGPEYGSWWGDEVRDASREGLLTAIGRLRCRKVEEPQYRWTTTANGHDIIWERHRKNATLERSYVNPKTGSTVKVWRGSKSTRLMVQAPTDVNTKGKEGYADMLSEEYDEQLALQERFGEFVVLGKRVYRAFQFEKNVSSSASLVEGGCIIVTLDFNVEPCVAVVLQEVHGQTWVVGEILIEDGGTPAVIDEFDRKWGNQARAWGMEIYGDPSGSRRDTRDNQSDYALWQNRFPRSSLHVARSDPGFSGRANAVNKRCCNDNGRICLLVSDQCPYLITDLESVTWRDGTRKFDKRDKNKTHLSDALSYYVAFRYPCIRHLDFARMATSDQGLWQ